MTTKKTEPFIKPNKLRQKAEVTLNMKVKGVENLPHKRDLSSLIHELEVHQIELEMQNEELKLAKEKAELTKKKYFELYDFAPSGYLTLTKTGEITDLNSRAEDLLGKERSRLINSSFGFFVTPDTRTVYNSFLQDVFNTTVKQSCEIKLITGDDSMRYILVNGILSTINEKCLVILTDISKHKQVESELIIAREKAEESDRLKTAFLANMSHEIRTPMNGILGFAELLKTLELTDEKKHEYIDIIEKSGTRMLNIINDIISISKIESKQIEVSVSETNINDQLKYIYHFFKLEAEQKKLHISFKNGLNSDKALILTDREKIYSVLTNLVKNAIKFTKTGSIELGYELKDGFIEFYVKNSGPVIAAEQKEIIFERFRQGNESLTRDFEGAGLGLSISKAYVEMLGGKIWVESELGQDSVFRFTIPYLTGIANDEPPKIVAEEESEPCEKCKILIVDDDEVSRLLLSIIIRPLGGEIFQTASSYEAVKICRDNPDIDLVLMDIKMQGMNGYEATRQIREFNKMVVIIAQTALALNGDREKALQAGCNDYISKPINQKTLFNLMNQFVR